MEVVEPTKSEKNGLTNGFTDLIKQVTIKQVEWPENFTEIAFVGQNLSEDMLESTRLPPNLATLNLSQNKLGYVPNAVLNLKCLKNLDLSHNKLEYFDETPSFCHVIERLNLEKNNLHGPPYWVWSERPEKLSYLNIRDNIYLTSSITEDYLKELLTYQTSVKHLVIENCKLGECLALLSTFVDAKEIDAGNRQFNSMSVNEFKEFPSSSIEKCLNIKRINLSNTNLFSISSNIEFYKNLTEIDLSLNNLSSLPTEFCRLKQLQVCVLSYNRLLYLPDSFTELVELTHLHLDSNELCILPEVTPLAKLQYLDLYNNSLSELPDNLELLPELDLGQNYFDEPKEIGYLEKREKLRAQLSFKDRRDGNKTYYVESVENYSATEYSSDDDDISWTAKSFCEDTQRPPSSIEDWDSDDYWIPVSAPRPEAPQSPWLNFVHQKMKEGYFCPMDLHTVPIIEQVRYDKLLYPPEVVVVPGQFDDLSGDER